MNYQPIPAGVIIKPHAGGSQSHTYKSRNPSLSWASPPGLSQTSYSPFVVDSNGCISYGLIDSIESQEIRLFGKTPQYSRRALAKMSGTDPLQGNDIITVFNTIKNVGLIPLEYWPELKSFTRDEYYAAIPAEVLAKAVRVNVSLKQYIPASDINQALAEAPVNAIITQNNPSHFVELINPNQFFDSEGPQIRQNSATTFHSFWQITLTTNDMQTNSLLVQHGQEFGFFDPCTKDDALISAMRNRGVEPPLNADGTLNWDAVKGMVQGKF